MVASPRIERLTTTREPTAPQPPFSPEDENGAEDDPATEARFVRRFQERIRELRVSTDALVVDLRDSTGGSTTIQNLLSASLSPVPLRSEVDVLRMTARLKDETQKRIEDLDDDIAANDLSNFFTDPATVRNNERAYLRRILDEFEDGRPFSSPFALEGMTEIPPARAPYIRPVVFLTNPWTVSSSETMPATFQDNRDRRQSVVIGERTGGLGGTVESVTFPNQFGITSIAYTESLSIRMDGRPLEKDLPPERFIESRGVVPNHEIRLTLEDLRSDFVDYRRAVNQVVTGEIAKYEAVHGRRRSGSQ